MMPPIVAAATAASARASNSGHVDSTAAVTVALEHLRTTHDSRELERSATKFARLLHDLLTGVNVPDALSNAGLNGIADSTADDLTVVYKKFGPACYIDSALPVTVHFLNKYAAPSPHLHSIRNNFLSPGNRHLNALPQPFNDRNI
jgi:hypothetical protein